MIRLVPTLILCVLAVAAVAEPPAGEVPLLEDPAAALIIIDVQDFYFPGGAVPLVEPAAASANAARLLAAFREHGRTIVHVGHKVRAGGDFHPDVAPQPGEAVVMKSEVNAFQGTDLLEILRQGGIDRVVICGMQTHMCVEGAARAAADHGFTVLVVADACATRDLKRAEVEVPAQAVQQSTLATLDGVYARVLDTDALLAGN